MSSQITIHNPTMERIEKITGKKFLKGGDKLINEALDKFENLQNQTKDNQHQGAVF